MTKSVTFNTLFSKNPAYFDISLVTEIFKDPSKLELFYDKLIMERKMERILFII